MHSIATRAVLISAAALVGWTIPAGAAVLEPVRVYVAVSGDTEATEQGKLAGWSDARLNDAGRRQAQAVARLLPSTIDAIYTSSLSRAIETAQLASGRFSMTSLPDLRPRNIGPFVGTLADDREFARRKSRSDDSLDGGETLSEYQARLRRAVMEMRNSLPAGNVLLIVHRSAAADVMSVLTGDAAVEIKVPSPGDVAVIDLVSATSLPDENR
jgi:broad specificity phosphatase PhoE